MDKEINRKYNDLLERSFKNDLYMFLFDYYISNRVKEVFVKDDYINFSPTQDLYNQFLSIHHLSKSSDLIAGTDLKIGDFDDFLNKWLINNKAIFGELRNAYSKRFLSKEDFYNFYLNTIKQCSYCGITEEFISELINQNKIYTKRLFSRGRSLEIDRKDSILTYTKDNIVFCCYWCNNAKTDEFSFEEFKKVGEQIKKIWKKRQKESLENSFGE